MLADVLKPLPYHRQIVKYLKSEEGALWQRYSSKNFLAERAESARAALLRNARRIEREGSPSLYAVADGVLAKLGLTIPLTLYQGGESAISYWPGEAHVALADVSQPGPIIAHELGHYLLWIQWDGEFLIAEQILESVADPAYLRSAELFRKYAEVYAGQIAAFVTGGQPPDEPLLDLSSPLEELDLVGQSRLVGLTRNIITQLAKSERALAHARQFFVDLAPALDSPNLYDARSFHESVQEYLCYVLLDFVAADPSLKEPAGAMSETLGVGEKFREIAAQELKPKRKKGAA